MGCSPSSSCGCPRRPPGSAGRPHYRRHGRPPASLRFRRRPWRPPGSPGGYPGTAGIRWRQRPAGGLHWQGCKGYFRPWSAPPFTGAPGKGEIQCGEQRPAAQRLFGVVGFAPALPRHIGAK